MSPAGSCPSSVTEEVITQRVAHGFSSFWVSFLLSQWPPPVHTEGITGAARPLSGQEGLWSSVQNRFHVIVPLFHQGKSWCHKTRFKATGPKPWHRVSSVTMICICIVHAQVHHGATHFWHSGLWSSPEQSWSALLRPKPLHNVTQTAVAVRLGNPQDYGFSRRWCVFHFWFAGFIYASFLFQNGALFSLSRGTHDHVVCWPYCFITKSCCCSVI